MKKKIVLLFIFILILLSGCFFQLPEKVTVKSTPTYNFNVGSFSKSLSEELDFSSLFKTLEEEHNVTVFDYNPYGQSEYQQFLLKMPIQDVPLDFNEFVANIGLSQSLEDVSFEKVVEIPEVKLLQTEIYDISQLHLLVGNFVAVESGITSNTISDIPFEGKEFFKEISYKSGTMYIITPSSGFVQILRNGQILYEVPVMEGVAKLDISGKTIYSDMQIYFSSDMSVSYKLFVDAPNVEQASGITLNAKFEKNLSIDLNFDSLGIKKCKIGEGEIRTDVKIPDSWSGVLINNYVELTGALEQQFTGNEFILDGIELEEDDVFVKAVVDVAFADSKIDLSNDIVLDVGFTIDSFEEIVLDLAIEEDSLSISEVYNFPEEFIQYVKAVYLKKSEIKGTYTNTLPEGNDILINAKSDFLELDNQKKLSSNKKNESFIIDSSNEERCKQLAESQNLDFLFKVMLPGATQENPNLLCIKNVTSGTTYELGMTLSFDLEWTKIVLNRIESEREKGVVATDFSISSIFEELDKKIGTSLSSKIEIDSFPLYLYVEKPSVPIFDNFSFADDSFIKIGNGTVVDDVVNFTSSPKEITEFELVSFPKLEYEENSNVVISDISKKDCSKSIELKDIINESESGETLCFQYDIGLAWESDVGEVVINKDELVFEDNETSISIYVAVVVPLKFNLLEDEEIDLLKVIDCELEDGKDLFGREEATQNETLETVLENIRSTSLKYEVLKSPFYAEPSMKLNVAFTPENKIDLGFKSGEISVDPEELLKVYPLQPKVILSIPKSTFYLSRECFFEAKVSLQIGADIEIELFGGQDEENN